MIQEDDRLLLQESCSSHCLSDALFSSCLVALSGSLDTSLALDQPADS